MFKELFYNSKTKRQNYSNLYRWRPGTTLKGVCRAHWTEKCHNLSRPATSKIVYDLRSRFGVLGTRRRDEEYRQKVSVHKRAMQRGTEIRSGFVPVGWQVDVIRGRHRALFGSIAEAVDARYCAYGANPKRYDFVLNAKLSPFQCVLSLRNAQFSYSGKFLVWKWWSRS